MMSKKRIAIINYWLWNNYGALLLAYALEETIRSMGYDAYTINWLPDERKKLIVKYNGFKKNVLRIGNSILMSMRTKQFKKFRNNINQSEERYTNKTLQEISDKYDKILIGSDQTWSTRREVYCEQFFLPWNIDNKKKICYSACIAQPDIRDDVRDSIIGNINDFAYITSREKDTADLIKRYTGIDTPLTCDPIFLIEREKWRSFQAPDEKQINKPFIFVYIIGFEATTENFIKRLAKDTRLDVIYCPFPMSRLRCHRKPNISPERWLWYIDNAEYVVTSSFHGTAFAILFNTPFFVNISKELGSASMRLTHILSIYSLESRIVKETDNYKYSNDDIDWNTINEKIAEDRVISMKHLEQMIDG